VKGSQRLPLHRPGEGVSRFGARFGGSRLSRPGIGCDVAIELSTVSGRNSGGTDQVLGVYAGLQGRVHQSGHRVGRIIGDPLERDTGLYAVAVEPVCECSQGRCRPSAPCGLRVSRFFQNAAGVAAS
jgi:hypothetical protein